MSPEEIARLIETIGPLGAIFAFIIYIVGRLDKKIEGLIEAQSRLLEAQSTGLQEIGKQFQDTIAKQAQLQRADNIERDKRFYKTFDMIAKLLDKLTNGRE